MGEDRFPLVVIVAYRSDTHLEACLSELDGGQAVTVVDNDANSGTAQIVAASGANYVAAALNVGFAAGVNLGLDRSWDGRSDVLLLNPDARLTKAQVSDLAAALHARGPRCGAVGPLLVGDTGRSQKASWPMPSPSQVWLDAFGLGRLWRGRRFITGAALLLRGEALAEVGGLDEHYFLYSEEADWQMRAQRAGWTVAVVPELTARHTGAASSSDPRARAEIFHASSTLFARRWYGRRGAAVMRIGTIVAATRRWLFSPQSRTQQAAALSVALRPVSRTGA